MSRKYELKMVRLNSTEDLGQFNDIIEDDEGYVWFSSAAGMHRLMETEPSPTRALKVNLVLIQIVFPAHLFF